jgi:hypothetical protein
MSIKITCQNPFDELKLFANIEFFKAHVSKETNNKLNFLQ